MNENTTGVDNTAVGGQALYYNNTGSNNTAVGRFALGGASASEYYQNTAVGSQAGNSITTGYNNVMVGYLAGEATTTGHQCILIGVDVDASAAGGNNQIVIGTPSSAGKGDSTSFISAAGGAVYAGNNSANFATTSDRRIKKNIEDNNTGLDAINQVRVRNFEYRTSDEIDELPSHAAIEKEGTQLGVIAQEIQQVLPDMVNEESTGCLSVNPANMTWYLVNAVKELSAKVAELEAKIGD